MMDLSDDSLVALSQVMSVSYNTTQDLTCFNISEEYYPCADITGCGGGFLFYYSI